MPVVSGRLRLTLADDRGAEARADVCPPPPSRLTLRCTYCGGDLLRSRLRRYDRLIHFFIRARRPFRCQDCGRRRWR